MFPPCLEDPNLVVSCKTGASLAGWPAVVKVFRAFLKREFERELQNSRPAGAARDHPERVRAAQCRSGVSGPQAVCHIECFCAELDRLAFANPELPRHRLIPTPGNTAPLWSLTVPLIWAVACGQ